MADRVSRLVGQLTLEEKVSLVTGAGIWRTGAVDRLGIPSIKVTDGPNGARGENWSSTSAVSFPCGTCLGATWDPELVEEVGQALGREAIRKGAQVLLAPTVNIHRSPQAGRNFECFSEDPYLSARMAVAYIRGVQSQGVGCCVKHCICNDSEFERMSISSEVTERPLREIYLRPFEAAVKEAGVWSVMGAYNRVNGVYACENSEILIRILKHEWGFDGAVISDWFGAKSTVESANGGLDLEMPGPGIYWGENLIDAVKEGRAEEGTLDEMVRRILTLVERTGAFEHPDTKPEQAVDDPADRELVRRAAGEGIVLLKNDHGVLPLDITGIKTLAVIGPNADTAVVQGGGSAQVLPHYSVSVLDAIRARCPDSVEVAFERGCVIHRGCPTLESRRLRLAGDPEVAGLTVEFFDNLDFAGSPVISQTSRFLHFMWLGEFAPELTPGNFSMRCHGHFVPEETGTFRFSLTSVGKSRLYLDGRLVVDNWSEQTPGSSFFGLGSAEVFGETSVIGGRHHEITIEFSAQSGLPVSGMTVGCMTPVADDLMERAESLAARADAVVVVVGLNSDWEHEGGDRPDLGLPGRQGELVERVGRANPNTVVLINAGSPVAMDFASVVPAIAQVWYPGQELGNAVCDVVFGDVNPSGKLPTTFPVRLEDTPSFLDYPGENGEAAYGEGIFVGYRYYDARKVKPRFCFGHGLSYTDFEYSNLSVTDRCRADEIHFEVAVDVTNTGERAGKEVAQVYVRDAASSLKRPEKELKGFAKVSLEPGQTKTVKVALDRSALACWNPAGNGWLVEPGEFVVLVGASSRDIRCRASFTLAG